MSRQGPDDSELPYYITAQGQPYAKQPSKIYSRVLAVIGVEGVSDFLNFVVSERVINPRQAQLLKELLYRRPLEQVAEKLGYSDHVTVRTTQKYVWGKILQWLTEQGKTLNEIGSFLNKDVPKIVDAKGRDQVEISKMQDIIQELGGGDAVQDRVKAEREFGKEVKSEFIVLLANVMDRLSQGGEDEDIIQDVRKLEFSMPPERAKALVRNAIDYFLLFPSPDSTPGVESGSEEG